MPAQKPADIELFHFEKDKPSFEQLAVENGSRAWREIDLMNALGYADPGSFRKAVTRAMQACLSLGIGTEENFLLQPGGQYKFTRFGCYLVAMNADSKKQQVAAAQAYFATLADTFQTALEHAEGIDRMLVREEMSDGMKSLSGVAKKHGVQNYAFFLNAGYRGMYNMNKGALEAVKRLPEGQQLLDRMGRIELAANLFRVTQTEARITAHNVRGQNALEDAAESVGRNVRQMVIDNTGVRPEHIPLAAPINEVKKALKDTGKKLKAIDGKQKKLKKP